MGEEEEESSQGTLTKGSQYKGPIHGHRQQGENSVREGRGGVGVGRAKESNGGKIETILIEQQLF